MSAETKKVNEGVVSSISDTDLVMVAGPNGGLKPISAKDFINSINHMDNRYCHTAIDISSQEWVRIAKAEASFMGIIGLTHNYNQISPKPVFVTVGGYPEMTYAGFLVSVLNNGTSFDAIRFVQGEGSGTSYIEVRFRSSKSKQVIVTLSNGYGITLLDATISTASASNVLKTIEFSGGGITSCQSVSYGLQCEKGGAHECRDYSADESVEEYSLSQLFGEPLSVYNREGWRVEKSKSNCYSASYYVFKLASTNIRLERGSRTRNIYVSWNGNDSKRTIWNKIERRNGRSVLSWWKYRDAIPTSNLQIWRISNKGKNIRHLERVEDTSIDTRKEVAL